MYATELYRVASYTGWPESAVVSPLHLAKIGFSYCGTSDEVECFACKTRLDGWRANDSPEERHRRSSPNCDLVNGGTATTNIPLKVSFPKECLTTSSKRIGRTATDNAELEIEREQENGLQPDDMKPGLFREYYKAVVRVQRKGVLWNDNDYNTPDFDALRSEAERLRTFFSWPSSAQMKPESLASAGLFYTGSGDRVQCAFCRGFLYNWNPSDSPAAEHERHYPDCLFVRHEDVGNIPIAKCSVVADSRNDNENAVRNPIQTGAAVPVSQERLVCESIAASAAEKIVAELPKYPEYSEYERRLQSLRRGKVSPGQTAEDLAEAGWFFVGPGDKVNCFQCGGNLKDWEPHDDPWQEHKKWYPQCSYIRTHKKRPRSQMQSQLIPQASASRFYVEPREIKARMDTPTTRAILDMGYSKDLIRMAIENRLTTKGDDFPNAESLLEALFELEESGSQARRLVPEMYQNGATATLSSNSTGSNSIASSQSSTVGHQSDCASLPAPKAPSNTAAESAFQSMTAVPSQKPAASATPALAPVPELVAEGTSKSRGKKKRNKKKKTAASATVEDDQQAETPVDTVNDQQKTEGDLNLEEIPDEETIKYLEENRQLREARTCKVCMDGEVNTVFLPCGHLVCCSNCAPHLKTCPICRTYIRGTVKTFLS